MKKRIYFIAYTTVVLLMTTVFFSCKPPQKAVTNSYANKNSNYFLFLSDVHLDSFSAAIDPKGNTGRILWNNCKIKIGSILDSTLPPAFILYTGDLPAHYSTNCDTCIIAGDILKTHNTNIRTVLTDLRTLVTKSKIPLLYAPGNNDGLDGDYFSFTSTAGKTPFSLVEESVNPYPALNVSKIDTGSAYMLSDEFIGSGYYAVKLMKGLRLISLNSVIFGQYYNVVDGISQLKAGNTEMAWLDTQLQNAATAKDKVYISMHIPPGTDAYKYDQQPRTADSATWAVMPAGRPWLNVFLGLMTQYQSTVAGLFYGHTHMDELRLLHDSLGNAIQVAISCPGISVDHKNNPGFKLVSFDAVSKMPLDFTTYYTHPYDSTWGNSTYRFSNLFPTNLVTPVFNRLKPMTNVEMAEYIKRIFTVMNGQPTYDITPGVEVKWVK